MRRIALPVVMYSFALPLACGGDEPKVSRADVERAVTEVKGTVALTCERDDEKDNVWNCRQGETAVTATATVNEDGSITVD